MRVSRTCADGFSSSCWIRSRRSLICATREHLAGVQSIRAARPHLLFCQYFLGSARPVASSPRITAFAHRLIPTPARFAFAFGRPDILAERRAERLEKWQWSDEFLAKARPDKGNYGQGDVFDDGLTKLERAQIEQGREAYLTGGAKLRYKRLTGQI